MGEGELVWRDWIPCRFFSRSFHVRENTNMPLIGPGSRAPLCLRRATHDSRYSLFPPPNINWPGYNQVKTCESFKFSDSLLCRLLRKKATFFSWGTPSLSSCNVVFTFLYSDTTLQMQINNIDCSESGLYQNYSIPFLKKIIFTISF